MVDATSGLRGVESILWHSIVGIVRGWRLHYGKNFQGAFDEFERYYYTDSWVNKL